MNHSCLIAFSTAPLWKHWHAISPSPDGGPLGSCLHWGSFCSTTWYREHGEIILPLVCKETVRPSFYKPVSFVTNCQVSSCPKWVIQMRPRYGANIAILKSISYICYYCSAGVRVVSNTLRDFRIQWELSCVCEIHKLIWIRRKKQCWIAVSNS